MTAPISRPGHAQSAITRTPQPLPDAGRAPLTKEIVAHSLLATINTSKRGDLPGYSIPLFTRKIEDAWVNMPAKAFNMMYGSPDREVVATNGSFLDAIKLANGRALSTNRYNQAQAVLDARNGSYFVTALGSFDYDTVGEVQIDGRNRGKSFEDVFGTVNNVTSHLPDLKAIVGANSYINLSNSKVETDLAQLNVKTAVGG